MFSLRRKSSITATKTRERLLLLVVALIGIAFAGLYPHAPDPPISAEFAASHRKPMTDFTVSTLGGPPWRLSEHRGHVVLLNFWATWCPPCQQETPELMKLSQDFHAQGLDVAGISMEGSSRSNIQPFVDAYSIPYPILVPKPFSAITTLATALPTTYLIDRQGRIANAGVGALDTGSLREEVKRLLREPSSPAQ